MGLELSLNWEKDCFFKHLDVGKCVTHHFRRNIFQRRYGYLSTGLIWQKVMK